MSHTKFCRLCAQPKQSVFDVSKCCSGGVTLSDLISSYLSPKVIMTKGFPEAVCCECNSNLVSFHLFVNQIQEAQLQLQKIITIQSNEEENLYEGLNDNWIKLEDQDTFTEIVGTNSNYMKRKENIKIRKKKKKRNNHETDLDDIVIKIEADEQETVFKSVDDSLYKRIETEENNILALSVEKIKSDDLKLVCYMCNENNFIAKSELRKHLVTHLGKDPIQPWPCNKCDKMFKSRHSVMRHIRVIHEGVSEFICDACGRSFRSHGNLGDHLATHSDVAKYECEKCSKKFKLKTTLKRHMDTHLGTVYQCPKCALLLNSRRTLRNHMFVHDEVGRQQCPFCGKRFKLKKTLKLHINIHTGERPYKCLWCPKTFTNNSNCRIHKKRVHKMELMKYEAEQDGWHCEQRSQKLIQDGEL